MKLESGVGVVGLQRVTWVVALLILGYGLVLALASPVGFPASLQTGSRWPLLSDKPVGEDGFYMLTVAWNLAQGQGLTSSSGEVTTGVQPLATIVFAAAALAVKAFGGDKWEFVRVVIVLGVATLVGLAFALGRIAQMITGPDLSRERLAASSAWAAVLAMTSFHAFRLCTYGLETGLYLLLVALTTGFVLNLKGAVPGALGSFKLGVLIGLTSLARVDFVVVAIVASVPLLLFARRWARTLVIAGFTALALVAPWFLWVHAVSSVWMPSSGTAQMGWSLSWSRASTMAAAIAQQLAPWFYSGARAILVLAQVMSVLFLGFLVWRSGRPVLAIRSDGSARRAFWYLAATTTSLVPVYLLLFGSGHFYGRYISPLMIFSIPAAALVISRFCGSGRRANFIVPAGLLVVFSVQAMVSLHRGRVGNSHSLAAGYVHSLHRSARVGAFQSGVLGYFNAGVYNLDGKVSRGALEALQAGRVGPYVESEGIQRLIGWPEEIEYLQRSSSGLAQWVPCPPPVPSTHRCVERSGSSPP